MTFIHNISAMELTQITIQRCILMYFVQLVERQHNMETVSDTAMVLLWS